MSDTPAAIITGGSRGIGKAIALELARLGYDIAVAHLDFTPDGRPDDLAAQATAREITALGRQCIALRADVSDADHRRNLLAAVEAAFGRCDFLMNNAGVAPQRRVDILQASEESFDRVLRINLKGPYFLTQLVANWMIRQKADHPDRPMRICNTSSVSAYTSSTGRGEYCISKAGVSMMTMLFADRLAEFNIGVFEVRPGIIETDMTAAVKEKYNALIAGGLTPIKRWGTAQDVAQAVGAIAQGRLDFCTGQVINVDGGFHLRRL